MTEIYPVSPISFDGSVPQIDKLGFDLPANPLREAVPGNFQTILSTGIDSVDKSIAKADNLVRQFAVDDNVPVHQVTMALEEARLSVELAMQVRSRLVESYRDLMNMQI